MRMDGESLFHIAPEFSVSYAPDLPGIVMTWRGYHTSPSFRAQNESVLTTLAAHRASKILCDIRHFLLIGSDDQAWLNGNWLPRAIDAATVAVYVQAVLSGEKPAPAPLERQVDLLQRALVRLGTTPAQERRA